MIYNMNYEIVNRLHMNDFVMDAVLYDNLFYQNNCLKICCGYVFCEYCHVF